MPLIYKIINTINDHFYIGWTKGTVGERWRTHVKDIKKGYCPKLYNAIGKYGLDNFTIEVIECFDCCEQAKLREVELIKQLNPHYNIAKGGEGGDTGRNADPKKRLNHSKFMKEHLSTLTEEERRSRHAKGVATRRARGTECVPEPRYKDQHHKWSGYWVVNYQKYDTSMQAARATGLNESTIIDMCVRKVDQVRKRTSDLVPKGKTPRECGYYKETTTQ